MELRICHLFPDILNLYGDRGNVTCMKQRLNWRGIDVSVEGISIGQRLRAADYDLFFIGGGQD
ncbi:MAG: glutamine amidotransferase, partial [Oscillospiraceae bacterium]|nr:glutamine amidotransferase [Oscillospiraceae bacterium]